MSPPGAEHVLLTPLSPMADPRDKTSRVTYLSMVIVARPVSRSAEGLAEFFLKFFK